MKEFWLGIIAIALIAVAMDVARIHDDIRAIAVHSGALDGGTE